MGHIPPLYGAVCLRNCFFWCFLSANRRQHRGRNGAPDNDNSIYRCLHVYLPARYSKDTNNDLDGPLLLLYFCFHTLANGGVVFLNLAQNGHVSSWLEDWKYLWHSVVGLCAAVFVLGHVGFG